MRRLECSSSHAWQPSCSAPCVGAVHGTVGDTIDDHLDDAERALADAAQSGLDLRGITTELELDDVPAFCSSYRELLDCINSKLPVISSAE